jgi:tetratricopeptide (TPR) repeat protein
VPGAPGRLRFAHALIRDTLYDQLSTARVLDLHRSVGEALEAIYESDPGPHLAELAQHFVAAAPVAGVDKAIEYARRAGDRAASQLAYEEAVRFYEMALSLVDDAVPRGELLLALGRARGRAGDTPGSKQAFREAAAVAERNGLTDQLALAALGYGAGAAIIWEVSRDDPDLVPLLERALDALGDEEHPLRVRVLARLAGGPLRDASFPPHRKAELSEEALRLARKLGDTATLAYALECYILARHSPTFTPEQLDVSAELVSVATQAGDKERLLSAHDDRFAALVELGDMDAAKRELRNMEKIARELRQPAADWVVRSELALLALLEGRLPEAETLIAESYALGERALSWNAAVTYRLQIYTLRWQQGRLSEIEDLVRSSVEDYPTYRIYRSAFAHMAATLGLAGEAREAFDALAANDFAALPFDETWIASMCLLAHTASQLRDGARAAAVYEPLLPYAERVAVSYPETTIASVSHYLGLAATAMGRRDDAEIMFEQALRTNERIGARLWLARTQHEYAASLVERGSAGDLERAEALSAAAQATYVEHGVSTSATAPGRAPQ